MIEPFRHRRHRDAVDQAQGTAYGAEGRGRLSNLEESDRRLARADRLRLRDIGQRDAARVEDVQVAFQGAKVVSSCCAYNEMPTNGRRRPSEPLHRW